MGHFKPRNQVIITSFRLFREAREPWINFDPLNVQYRNAVIEESNVLQNETSNFSTVISELS